MGKWPRMDRDLLQHVQRRAHRDHRLPVGRGADPHPAGPVRRGRAGRGRAAGHVRQGELLRRADGPRARDRDAGHQGPAAPGRVDRRARSSRRTTCTTPSTRTATRTRCCCASSRARPWPTRDRFKFDTDQFYLKSAEEMRRTWAEIPEACDNTLLIAEQCEVEFNTDANYMPNFPVPAGERRGLLVHQGGRDRPAEAVPRDGSRRTCARRPSTRPGVITQLGFSGLLPRGRRLHQLGQGPGHPRGSGPWVRAPARWRRTRWASPSWTRWSTA